tara:strand:- start:3697 stop:3882 length:186 start_codon:yes stop_codon:yes gene_type:complete
MPDQTIQKDPLNLWIQTGDICAQGLLLGDVFLPNSPVPNDINRNNKLQILDEFWKLFPHHQ